MFMRLQYDGTLKIRLYIDHTKVNMVYTPDSDHKDHVILEQGEVAVPLDPMLDGRVSIEGSMFYLKKVKVSDMGIFRVTDLSGFHIADVYVNVEREYNSNCCWISVNHVEGCSKTLSHDFSALQLLSLFY